MNLTRRSLLIGATAAGGGAVALAHSPVARLVELAQSSRTAQSPGRYVDVRSFGARGDGRSDDRSAIQAAIDLVSSSGGGTVHLPAGTYIVSRAGTSVVAVTLKSNVTLAGDGPTSVLKLQDHSGGHTINCSHEQNCAVRDLTIDGNRANQPSTGHAFRSGGVDGLLLQNLTIRNAYHYGMGFEGGINQNIRIDSVDIHDVGGDGIDFKNKDNRNSNVVISNVSVRRWGLRTDRPTQAGIDCRGRIQLSNIRIAEPAANDATGVRMRQGETTSVNGLGGHDSTLETFDIRMGDGSAQIGIDAVARSVSVTSGTVSGGRRGVQVQASGFHGTDIHVSGCSETGILLDAHGGGLDADGAVLSGCTVEACGGNGITVEADGVRIANCKLTRNRAFGILIQPTASGTEVVGGDYAGNGSGKIANRGASSRIAAAIS